MNYLETNSLIDDEQNGFRKYRSCEDDIFNANLDTFTCFVDMQKAFDRVNRDILCTKLAKIGVNGNFLDTLKHLYTDCQAAVDVNGTYTAFYISSGEKQGDVISPTLFAIFINDLCQGMKK